MSLRIGDEILEGKYYVLDIIGQGQFGKVYLADDVPLKRRVAIKELRREDWTEEEYVEFRRRFQKEARIGAALRHENVVEVYTLEPSGEDPYLVMEYVDGESLQERLEEQGPSPIEEAVEIAMQLCDGLAAVHDHPLGIVHRDIKPSNIVLTGQGQPKLSDFGLAQLHGESLRSLGKGARHPGTPAYMSPEQETSSGYLRPSSDIYSLGCVLFEMLTGKVYKRVEESRPGRWRPEVPGWLDEVLARMLALDWRSRYQEAALLRSDLSDGLTGELEIRRKLSALLNRAEQALDAQDRAEAIRLCEEGLELRPGHARLGNLLAQAKNGEAQEAERRTDEEQEQRKSERRDKAGVRNTETKWSDLFGGLARAAIIGVSLLACLVGLWWASRQFGGPTAPLGESLTPAATAPATIAPMPAAPPSPTDSAPATLAPTPTVTPAATLAPTNSEQTYVVRPGDTISLVAGQFGVTPESIMLANGLSDYMVRVGQELIIPLDSATRTATTVVEATLPLDRTTYVVQVGDTARGIAERFGVTMKQLMEANDISDPDSLFEGQVLVMPAAPSLPAAPPTNTRVPPTASPTPSEPTSWWSDLSPALPPVVIFSDHFSSATLEDGWHWVDPAGDCEHDLTHSQGAVRIGAPGNGHDLYTVSNFDAPRLVFPITGDFDIWTRVEIDGWMNYQGAGLLVWHDTRNYVRLEQAHGYGEEGIHIWYSVDGTYVGGGRDTQTFIECDCASVYLRLSRNGSMVNAYYATDGVAWRRIRDVRFNPSEAMVGLVVINNWHEDPLYADFDFFEVRGF